MVTVLIGQGAPISEITRALEAYIRGEKPANVTEEPLETALMKGRAIDCGCGLIECVCDVVRGHADDCRFRRAMLAPVSFECKHGKEACAECDPCDCIKNG
jgi:hypothetical protein